MGKIRQWWSAHRPTTRRLVQLYCALLYNANIKGFIEGEIFTGNTKAVCVPGLNCYSCPGAVGACPLGAFQNAVASSGMRAGTYVAGILLLFGLMLGRTICGWLCPLGMIQELLYKIPTFKIRKSRVTRVLSYLKYVILAVFVFTIPLWYGIKYNVPVPAFCKYICPAGTLEGAMGLLGNPANSDMFSMLDILFTRKTVVLLGIILLCIFFYRAFCRFLCPLGAIYGLFNRFALTGVKVNPVKCTHCGKCVRNCRMDVRRVGDHECISCGECMSVCADDAISITAGGITLKGPAASKETAEQRPGSQQPAAEMPASRQRAVEHSTLRQQAPGERTAKAQDSQKMRKKSRGRGRIAWGAAIPVLVSALVYFNVYLPGHEKSSSISGSGTPDVSYESSAPTGSAEGEQLKDFEIPLCGGGSFHLKDMRGRIVIINRWATWCAPCVQEIPFFCRIREENPDISILLVHGNPVLEDLDEYLEKQQWGLDVAVDSDDAVCDIVDGSASLPQTTVLNARGEVIYNQTGSMTYEKLCALVEKAEDS